MSNQEGRQFLRFESRFSRSYLVVVTALYMMIAMWGTYYAFGIFFRPMLTEFGWTRAMTSGAFSLSMVLHGLLGIVAGGMTDRFGPRVVMTLCGFLLGLGYLLMSQTRAIWQLYLFYGVIIGTGMGGAFVPILSTVARCFVKRRSLMTGIVLTGIGIGSLLAPPFANWLVSIYAWRVSYAILGTIVFIIVIIGAQFLRRDLTQAEQLPDVENEGEGQESKLKSKTFSLNDAASTRQFWLAAGLFFCFGFCLFAVMVHLVPHLLELGISTSSAARVLATVGGMSIIGNFLLGSAADKIGNRQIFMIGFVLLAATLFWFVLATKVWVLFLVAAIFGFAQGGMGASESPLVAGLFGLRSHGLIFGVVGLGFTSGAAVGPFLAGHIFDVMGSYQAAFLVCAAMGIAGLIATTFLTPIKTS